MSDMSTLHELADALIRLGTLLKDADTGIEDLTTAAHACGLRLEFRLVPMSSVDEEEPEEHQHVWTCSMGDTHERCVGCGEMRPAPWYADPNVGPGCVG